MTDSILHHADILAEGAVIGLARAELGRSRPRHLHGHDFYELLWVQNGTMRHHTPAGTRDIAEGGLILVRPGDSHAVQGRDADTLVVSVTLAPGLVDGLAARHEGLRGILFWQTGPAPLVRQRDSRQMADLNRAANLAELSALDALAAEAFLLPLLSDMAGAERVAQLDDKRLADMSAGPSVGQPAKARPAPARPAAPDWLIAACAAARDPGVFREGAAGIVRLSGRAHPHVSRTMRKYYGQSPSEFVNAQRMAYAARRLAGTADTLSEIAADCGIPNLSHFHKLFRAAHGQTPQAHRRTHRRDVLQP